jgi:PP-loop superfamily ATP-utilizing enzyme
MPRVLEHRAEIVAGIRRVGYDYVTLDLSGYKKGGRATDDG